MSEKRKRVYETLPYYSSKEEVLDVLNSDDLDDLRRLGLGIGFDFYDGKFAQDICLKLVEHKDEVVRSSACLGLAHVARVHKKLDKRIVKPILLRELRNQTKMQWQVIMAIEEINFQLGWNMASKSIGSNLEGVLL